MLCKCPNIFARFSREFITSFMKFRDTDTNFKVYNLQLKNCAWSFLCLWSHTITCLILPFLSFFDNFVKNTHTCQLMKIKTCSGQRRTTWGENFNISSLPYHSIFSLRNSPEWKQISYRNFLLENLTRIIFQCYYPRNFISFAIQKLCRLYI